MDFIVCIKEHYTIVYREHHSWAIIMIQWKRKAVQVPGASSSEIRNHQANAGVGSVSKHPNVSATQNAPVCIRMSSQLCTSCVPNSVPSVAYIAA